MAYSRITWQNEITPLNAENLNRIEDGIEDALNAIDGMSATIRDLFYPVGSYYETSDASFDPNTAWGGTWSLEAAGKVHIGAGTGYAIGSTGGEKTHTLTVSEMPSHTHTQQSHNHTQNSHNHTQNPHTHNIEVNNGYHPGNGGTIAGDHAWAVDTAGTNFSGIVVSATATNQAATATNNSATAVNNNTGGGSAHNNMQPYIVVNRWHRTA